MSVTGPTGVKARCQRDVLGLLEFFRQPRTLAEASGLRDMAHDWAHLMRTVLSLVDAGVLAAPDSGNGSAGPRSGRLDRKGFGSAAEHISMLNDRDRTGKYIEAIRQTVTGEDTVVDLGCGTGVLAAAAAVAGARSVHAIERSRIGALAEQLFSVNGLADRVHLHQAAARDVELDQRAEVLVTELIGNEPLSERILEHVIDARRRLLSPEARIIPTGLDLYAQCFSVATPLFDSYRFTSADIERWSRWYGLDFSALENGVDGNGEALPLDVSPSVLLDAAPCGDAALLASLDLATIRSADVDTQVSIPATTDAAVNAVFISFVIRLTPEIRISRLLENVNPQSSWNCRLWLPKAPLRVKSGETINIAYRHDPLGTGVSLSASPA